MTLELILIRHAKSSWSHPGIGDHERPLNKRGRNSADRIGAWMKAHDLFPDEVLCSTARRAVETWEAMSQHVGDRASVGHLKELYLAGPREMLDCLHGASGARVAMVGHNPGIALFAAGMCRQPSGHPDFNRYPTCATAVMSFDAAGWRDVGAGEGEILDFIVPRQLG